MKPETVIVWLLLLCVFIIHNAYPETVIRYKDMPVPSAHAPSISSFNNKMCRTGISGGYNGGIFSAAVGTTIVDETCEKVTLAQALDGLGLKVAAVSVLCEDPRVWRSMLNSGSVCPLNGAVGDAALHAWYDLHPERFEEIYGKDWRPPTVTYPME